ncbi:uncharacterized protein Z518_05077 [Rhinocladiella mackenziei CBS 650.93]|uniref:Anaphase-promoting complex subunit 11 n=1 Tax=Rhinocladiella mackenziei CBS 650.93 TaxID=1442369 RepID=A0A0D2JD66_9EURO|nr:uncharacterized protein Z518_05077 [Rhinocladiella mackenziei CBS 650.93]KIX07100.1 hypothetical protein Z518_05077 [Rhinocladiella mackenziei CBS 650.93]
MSQPRQVPTHSSSPSKSSLRRTSGPQNPSARNLLPSPHFEDDPIVASHQPTPNSASSEHEHAIAGAESDQYGHSEPIPPFQPFFTLIEDSVTNEHHHPTVHYIFADDDSDIIAEAACRSLETLDPSQRASRHVPSREHHHDEGESRLPPPIAGVREHYLILDVQPRNTSADEGSARSFEVTSARSLSAEWQVLRSTITTAPTIGNDADAEDDGLMLRIEGRGNSPGDAPPSAEKESTEEMIERFQRRLDDIRQMMDTTALGGPGGGAEE